MTVFYKDAMPGAMVRPVLLKLGGSVITDKATPGKFRKPATKRLLGECQRAGAPLVLFHGAGSYGHPPARKHGAGKRPLRPDGVSEILTAVSALHAEVLQVAQGAGLKPLSFPLHQTVTSDGGQLEDYPVQRMARAIQEGYTPVLSGTLVRDDHNAWRVASADELLADLAVDLDPRLAVFCSNVDGVLGPEGLLDRVTPAVLDDLFDAGGSGDDVTGRMAGKLERAFAVASVCPTWIINGDVRGRLQDVLKGKEVPGTRIEID